MLTSSLLSPFGYLLISAKGRHFQQRPQCNQYFSLTRQPIQGGRQHIFPQRDFTFPVLVNRKYSKIKTRFKPQEGVNTKSNVRVSAETA